MLPVAKATPPRNDHVRKSLSKSYSGVVRGYTQGSRWKKQRSNRSPPSSALFSATAAKFQSASRWGNYRSQNTCNIRLSAAMTYSDRRYRGDRALLDAGNR